MTPRELDIIADGVAKRLWPKVQDELKKITAVQDEILDMHGAAATLGVSYRFVKEHAEQMPSFRVGERVRFSKAALLNHYFNND